MPLSLQYDEASVIRDYFASRLVPGSTGMMVDVGAHFGTSFRAYLNAGWRVLAFEPDATKFPKLAPYEGKAGFELLKVAVSDSPREAMPFYTSTESTGISSLLAFRESHTLAASVPVVTLADVLAQRKIRHIDFLKIDTEGYDLQVLRGHDWSIRPEIILTEFDEVKTRHLGHHFDAIADLIAGRGYTIYLSEWFPLERYGANHQWRSISRYPVQLHHDDAWGNLIAVRNDAQVDRIADIIAPAQHAK
jgi:FkbM family methyltransferase